MWATSSPTTPSLMARMLDMLNVNPGCHWTAHLRPGDNSAGKLSRVDQSVSSNGILRGMRTTTIKVDRAVRDRLACIARARGTTMGALLDTESRRLEAEQRWTEIESAYERLQHEDPEGWRDYLGELAEVNADEPDTTAALEWPEYNR